MKQLKQVHATGDPFASMSVKEKQDFLGVFPHMMDSWYNGAAMGEVYKVQARSFAFKWGTKAFRDFLGYMQLMQKLLPHKPVKLYRMLSIPYTDKNKFKLQPGRNPVHSWTDSLAAARYLYKLAYQGRVKKTQAWSYLIVQTTMPANRIGIDYRQVTKLVNWVLKNFDKLYAAAEFDPKGLYSPKNVKSLWMGLHRKINTRLIKEQQEFICMGNQPLSVEVVERLQ